MKINISKFYKDRGYKAVYVNINKEPRRVATLVHNDGTKTSMSYAKYLYTSHHECDIDGTKFHIDHINNDKMDDRIENLQLISGTENRKKGRFPKMIIQTCPVCGKQFEYRASNLPSHPNPCCSRKCGGIKSHWKKNTP